MIISRIWEMPNKYTFKMKCVQNIFEKYNVGPGWIDPFAGKSTIATFRNDIREEMGHSYVMDGLEFLQRWPDNFTDGVLFDPPYSVEQCLRKYTPKFKGTAGKAEYWAKCKDEIARIIKPNGLAMCFGWNSCGLGIKREFELIEVLLVCHGACHNDTIVTIEKKH